MKQIILILTIISIVCCNKNVEKENSEIDLLNDKIKNPKTEINSQLSKEKREDKITDNSPVETALKFINLYITDCNKVKESVGYINFVKSSQLTSNSFKIELQKIVEEAEKEDPEMGLDFNPIVNGQDYPEEGFELKYFNPKTNYIIMKGKKWTDFEVTMKLVLVNEKWLVDGCGIVNIPENYQSKR
ncbi:hypothetical protein Q361_1029 [Flavobacterium croceum DSM 17960]|uniref:DUF3828 domain-containing protein n=1 Tax=Flavobacterium croceum DSM 17960 TaxID=1121886 RepID=A0A2S4NAH0_9FLAO|nr:hypothetical protein [Flavobacterium croceum]POS02699.1 hypothetical protein Q361_1029 [Flavobacterium croceum DSM 17960]